MTIVYHGDPNASYRKGAAVTKLATTAEVAEYLGVTPEALRQWAHRGVGPAYIRVEGARRYRWSDVEAYLTERTVQR
jgi:excisionase family DNA binding protein